MRQIPGANMLRGQLSFWLMTIGLLATVPAARAQQTGKIFRIGFLDSTTASGSADRKTRSYGLTFLEHLSAKANPSCRAVFCHFQQYFPFELNSFSTGTSGVNLFLSRWRGRRFSKLGLCKVDAQRGTDCQS
jgi:hypothetical protein